MNRLILIVSLLILIAHAEKASAECPASFESALNRQFDALDNRDLAAYMSAIPERADQLMILPDGSTWASRDEIESSHAEWFKDETWVFNRELKRQDVRDHWGVAIYRISVDRPDSPGKPFLLSMLFAPEEGCWYLQHDQNTLLPQ